VYSNTTAVLIGTWVAHKNNIPHYWHVHEIIQKPTILRKAIQWLMQNRCTKVICVSKAVQDHWTNGKPSLANKTIVIYNGIEPMQYQYSILEKSAAPNFRTIHNIPQEAIVIGMAGRVHFWKGQQYFLEIAKQLLELTRSQHNNSNSNPSLYFIITGDAFPGYEYLVEEIKDFISNHHLGAQIFYTGFESNMDKFYSSIDLLILPSQLPDPLPTVVLEAMQYGIPVAATPQGGALEMIKANETGIFIPMHNAKQAAEMIDSYLSAPSNFSEESKIDSMQASDKKIQIQKRAEQFFSKEAFEQNITKLFQ
jgi:glycosyltransferase involved in cell wall biosynthesis